jgi:hypothetical protein
VLDKLFRKKEPRAFVRACAVFVNPTTGHTIIAPYTNMDGLYVEQPNACETATLEEEVLLGRAIKAALLSSKYADSEISHGPPKKKKSDWPSFQASGTKTVKEFEARYVPVVFRGVNEANLIYQATGPEIGKHGLHLRVYVNAHESDGAFASATAVLIRETQRLRGSVDAPGVPPSALA